MPRVKDNNRLGTQKTDSFKFDEELARKGRQGNFEISKLITIQSIHHLILTFDLYLKKIH